MIRPIGAMSNMYTMLLLSELNSGFEMLVLSMVYISVLPLPLSRPPQSTFLCVCTSYPYACSIAGPLECMVVSFVNYSEHGYYLRLFIYILSQISQILYVGSSVFESGGK
jgi:hypothetical protein